MSLIIILIMLVSSVKDSAEKILYPSEYECRANMMIEARRLVGGIEIEKENIT